MTPYDLRQLARLASTLASEIESGGRSRSDAIRRRAGLPTVEVALLAMLTTMTRKDLHARLAMDGNTKGPTT